mgnify:CR=1 FL=1
MTATSGEEQDANALAQQMLEEWQKSSAFQGDSSTRVNLGRDCDTCATGNAEGSANAEVCAVLELPVVEDTADDLSGQLHGDVRSTAASAQLTGAGAHADNGVHVGTRFQLNFVDTWGDPYYLGLTSLYFLDQGSQSGQHGWDCMWKGGKGKRVCV